MEKEPKRRLKRTSKTSKVKAKTSNAKPKAEAPAVPQRGWSAQLPAYSMTERNKPPANQVPNNTPSSTPSTHMPSGNYGWVDG